VSTAIVVLLLLVTLATLVETRRVRRQAAELERLARRIERYRYDTAMSEIEWPEELAPKGQG
jgi:HAMP domain-containing protein